MHQINGNRRKRTAKPAATALLAILLACLGLAACGGSSKSSSTSASAAATTSTGAGAKSGSTGAGAGRFTALRECLQKNGITLPQRPAGTRRTPGAGGASGAGGFLSGAGGPQLPKGVTRAQYEAAIKKCGGRSFGGAGSRLQSPAYKQALAKFAACMRENGVNVPAPNTSGKGPVFNVKGLNTASTTFKTAETKCSSDLRGSFRPGAGGAAPGGAGGAPPGA